VAEGDYSHIRPEQRERIALAKKRLASVLRTRVVASWRTLEQKIADAGPTNQRVDPHLLTLARREMEAAGTLVARRREGMPWFHLPGTPERELIERLEKLGPIHDQTSAQAFTKRAGQALEIAIFRSLSDQRLPFLGGFSDLDDHDDSQRYAKEDPPSIVSGRRLPGKMKLDFLIIHASAGAAGIEAKNTREWLYPDRQEVRDLLLKCCAIDAVPVLVARRLSYSTFSILHGTGVLVHQTFNQRYPYADAALAELARHKDLLGYHDIRIGNEPDDRLNRFLHNNLPALIPLARERFEKHRDLLERYARGELEYAEFAWRVRQRGAGTDEDEPQDRDWAPF
jgi:hypothetical protein